MGDTRVAAVISIPLNMDPGCFQVPVKQRFNTDVGMGISDLHMILAGKLQELLLSNVADEAYFGSSSIALVVSMIPPQKSSVASRLPAGNRAKRK